LSDRTSTRIRGMAKKNIRLIREITTMSSIRVNPLFCLKLSVMVNW
jgi:hypothetical protein